MCRIMTEIFLQKFTLFLRISGFHHRAFLAIIPSDLQTFHSVYQFCISSFQFLWYQFLWYGDSAGNTVEESVFSLIRMHWLPSVL